MVRSQNLPGRPPGERIPVDEARGRTKSVRDETRSFGMSPAAAACTYKTETPEADNKFSRRTHAIGARRRRSCNVTPIRHLHAIATSAHRATRSLDVLLDGAIQEVASGVQARPRGGLPRVGGS